VLVIFALTSCATFHLDVSVVDKTMQFRHYRYNTACICDVRAYLTAILQQILLFYMRVKEF